MSPQVDPRNPYESVVLSASAGCGKTYQLSQRFFFLVTAGADPRKLLTITFTNKAADEMRERILSDASRLVGDAIACQQMDALVKEWFKHSDQEFSSYSPPVPMQQAAQEVLACSSNLAVSTMDALFLEWVRQFPGEAGLKEAPGAEGQRAASNERSGVQLADPMELDQLAHLAWNELFDDLNDDEKLALEAYIREEGWFATQNRCRELSRLRSFLWYAEALHPERPGLILHPVGSNSAWPDLESRSSQWCDEAMRAAFVLVAEQCQPAMRERILTAHCLGYEELRATGILAADGFSVSGRFVRGKKREALGSPVLLIETQLQQALNGQRIHRLNSRAILLYRIYQAFEHRLMSRKRQLGVIDFSDLASAAFRIMRDPDAVGARFLLQKRYQHVMIDEFQDTSALQWDVFRELASELLSGEGLMVEDSGYDLGEHRRIKPSVFLVGDEKQSIYGFREAEPTILRQAGDDLAVLGAKRAHLEQSYRSSQIVLDLVNLSCAQAFDRLQGLEYHRHTTAELGGEAVVCDVGELTYVEVVDAESEAHSATAHEVEADALVAYVKELLAQRLVYDKSSQSFRACEYSDIAILSRSTTNVGVYRDALREAGIPCSQDVSGGFYESPEVRDLCCLIRWLAFPGDLLSFGTLMRSPMIGWDEHTWVSWLLQHNAALTELAPYELSKNETWKHRLPEQHPWLLELFSQRRTQTPHRLILASLQKSAWYEVLCKSEEQGCQKSKRIKSNIEQLVTICMHEQDRSHSSLPQLAARLAELANYNETQSSGQDSNSVRLMTIHKSKGLEFAAVCLVDTASAWQKRDLYWAKGNDLDGCPGVYYMGTKSHQPRGDEGFERVYSDLDRQGLEETWRLVYVALTRASQYVYVSGALKKSKSSPTGQRSEILEALRQAMSSLGAEEVLLPSGSMLKLSRLGDAPTADQLSSTTIGAAVAPCAAWQQVVAALNENGPRRHALSGSHDAAETLIIRAHAHETVEGPRAGAEGAGGQLSPDEPFAKSLDHPESPSIRGESNEASSAVLGTWIHEGLEWAAKHHKWELDELLDVWKAEKRWLDMAEDSHSSKQVAPSFEMAMKRFKAVFESPAWRQLFADSERWETEMDVVGLEGKQLIRGRIDLVLFKDRNLSIIDYKTSNLPIKKQLEHARGQLHAYKLVSEKAYPGHCVRAGIFATEYGELCWL